MEHRLRIPLVWVPAASTIEICSVSQVAFWPSRLVMGPLCGRHLIIERAVLGRVDLFSVPRLSRSFYEEPAPLHFQEPLVDDFDRVELTLNANGRNALLCSRNQEIVMTVTNKTSNGVSFDGFWAGEKYEGELLPAKVGD